jgi:hypothetical protein
MLANDRVEGHFEKVSWGSIVYPDHGQLSSLLRWFAAVS